MSDKRFLLPLFDRVERFLADDAILALTPPDAKSSLGAEDALLAGWPTSHLVSQVTSAGIGHVDALRRTVTQLHVIDAHAPWTLLRAALEDFSTAVWLVCGDSREERLTRTLRTWAYDFDQRRKWENDTGYTPTGQRELSGADRRQQIIDLGTSMGLDPKVIGRDPTIVGVLDAAAAHAGLDVALMRATWRIASGFAHGRMWPNLRAATPRAAHEHGDGYFIAFVIDDARLAELTGYCTTLLDLVMARYDARSRAPS